MLLPWLTSEVPLLVTRNRAIVNKHYIIWHLHVTPYCPQTSGLIAHSFHLVTRWLISARAQLVADQHYILVTYLGCSSSSIFRSLQPHWCYILVTLLTETSKDWMGCSCDVIGTVGPHAYLRRQPASNWLKIYRRPWIQFVCARGAPNEFEKGLAALR